MNFATTSLLLVATLLFTQGASAQETVGDLTKKGASRLNKTEVTELLTGTTITGPNRAGGTASLELKADGSMTGNVSNPNARGSGGGIFGTWKVERDGRMCSERTISGYGSRSQVTCGVWYKLGSDYYVSDDSEETTPAFTRTIKK